MLHHLFLSSPLLCILSFSLSRLVNSCAQFFLLFPTFWRTNIYWGRATSLDHFYTSHSPYVLAISFLQFYLQYPAPSHPYLIDSHIHPLYSQDPSRICAFKWHKITPLWITLSNILAKLFSLFIRICWYKTFNVFMYTIDLLWIPINNQIGINIYKLTGVSKLWQIVGLNSMDRLYIKPRVKFKLFCLN